MDKFISELHYYLSQNLWHKAIDFCTEELDKGRDQEQYCSTTRSTVLNLEIPGLHFLKTERSVYPDCNLLSHIINGNDADNVGIAGIKKVFENALRESTNPISLSIAMKIQYAAWDEL